MAIDLNDNLDIQAPKHIDERLNNIMSIADLYAIENAYRYPGMEVWVSDEETFYYLDLPAGDDLADNTYWTPRTSSTAPSLYVTQLAYVSSATGDDLTGELGNPDLPFATLNEAAKAFTTDSGRIVIEAGATLVETVNLETGVNSRLKELRITGAFTSITCNSTRPFQITTSNIEVFELNKLSGAGAIISTADAFVVLCEAWTGSKANKIDFKVGDVTFVGNNNSRVFTCKSVTIDANISTGDINGGSPLAISDGTYGNIDCTVNGNVICGISGSNSDSCFEWRSGAAIVNLIVSGFIDNNAFTNSTAGVFACQGSAENGHIINIKADINSDKVHTWGYVRCQDFRMHKSFTYSGRIYGSGNGSLVYTNGSAGSFDAVINIENVNKETAGTLVTKVNTGNTTVNISNSNCDGLAVSSGGAGTFIANFREVNITGLGATLFSTSEVTGNNITINVSDVIVNAVSVLPTHVIIAPSATEIIGTINVLGSIRSTVDDIADVSKYTINNLTDLTASGGGLTPGNGLSEVTTGVIGLGGTLTEDTTINVNDLLTLRINGVGSSFNADRLLYGYISPGAVQFDINNAAVTNKGTLNVNRDGASLTVVKDSESSFFRINQGGPKVLGGINVTTGAQIEQVGVGDLLFNNLTKQTTFEDLSVTKSGIEYLADYSANFTNRSLVDKEYVDGLATASNLQSVLNEGSTADVTTFTRIRSLNESVLQLVSSNAGLSQYSTLGVQFNQISGSASNGTNQGNLLVDSDNVYISHFIPGSTYSISVQQTGIKLTKNLNDLTFNIDSITSDRVTYWGDFNHDFRTPNLGDIFTYDGTNAGWAAPSVAVQSQDFEITGSANGVILESPDGTRYRITVANGGTLTVTAV